MSVETRCRVFSLVTLRLVLKQHEGYFGADLAIFNRGQMTRATPELAPLFKLPHHTSGRTFGPYGFSVHQTCLHGSSSVESNLEPSGRDFITRPPRPFKMSADLMSNNETQPYKDKIRKPQTQLRSLTFRKPLNLKEKETVT
ncbi:hypothetical protein AVEN_198198-1 [Araneus ventricosus]|uniref:Uncharacterized protein n=1 Tax=Araneus ventricosus TaxID=182803 RepID=A0A4Y2E859_ARAVE|nr:hypothetical protein AVEN_198198-1 [Araneus ventricosus]